MKGVGTNVTPADVWRLYVKPSMGGRLVVRKKTVNRKSARVMTRNYQIIRVSEEGRAPAKLAREMCMREPWRNACVYEARVYIPGEGYRYVERCHWKCFTRLLRIAFRQLGLTRPVERVIPPERMEAGIRATVGAGGRVG